MLLCYIIGSYTRWWHITVCHGMHGSGCVRYLHTACERWRSACSRCKYSPRCYAKHEHILTIIARWTVETTFCSGFAKWIRFKLRRWNLGSDRIGSGCPTYAGAEGQHLVNIYCRNQVPCMRVCHSRGHPLWVSPLQALMHAICQPDATQTIDSTPSIHWIASTSMNVSTRCSLRRYTRLKST